MDNHLMSLDATTSKVLPVLKQEGQSTSQSSEDKQNGTEYVTCHLCAIDMPRRFIIEHYRSDKHKINTKIAAVALERVQKSLKCNIVSDIDRTEALYFCPQCMVTLNPTDKTSHNKTIGHKKALTVDRFLYDFYVLYSNDERNTDADLFDSVEVKSNNVEPNNVINNISSNDEKVTMTNMLNISENIEIKTEDSIGKSNNIIEPYPIKNDNSNVTKVEEIPNKSFKSKVDARPSNDSPFCTFGPNKAHVFCKSCKVYVPNNASNIMTHEKGFKHKEILKKIKSLISHEIGY